MNRARRFLTAVLIAMWMGLGIGCRNHACESPAQVVRGSGTDVVELYQMHNLDAAEGARLAHEVYGVFATQEESTNTMILRGAKADVDSAKELIKDLDIHEEALRDPLFFVYRFKNARAEDVATILQVFVDAGTYQHDPGSLRPGALVVAVDKRTNALVIHVDAMHEGQTRELLDILDKPLP